jgi:hypothetical protein
MKNNVSVIVPDNTIIVDDIALVFEFSAEDGVKAIQWHNGKGHIEYLDNSNVPVNSYITDVQPYVRLWETEKARIDAEIAKQEADYNKFENVQARALIYVDSIASTAILEGFDYEINGETLHFSYDSFDQLNFNDTFNGVAMKKLMGIETLPEFIEWNGWRNHTKEYKGDLVRLILDVDAFITLYVNGALIHKSEHMDICGKQKEAIKAAKTVEEIEALLAEWNIN